MGETPVTRRDATSSCLLSGKIRLKRRLVKAFTSKLPNIVKYLQSEIHAAWQKPLFGANFLSLKSSHRFVKQNRGRGRRPPPDHGNDMDQKNYPPAALAWLVWGLGAAFYFSGFYHRVAPAVMTDQLMADFHIGAAGLGNFTAFYFYSYFLMQVPTGILADHWGPRKLLTADRSSPPAGPSCLPPPRRSFRPTWEGSSSAARPGSPLSPCSRLVTRWFPPRFFATVAGSRFSAASAAPFPPAPPAIPRRSLRLAARDVRRGGIFLLIGAAIWRIVRDDPAQTGLRSFAPPDRELIFHLRHC